MPMTHKVAAQDNHADDNAGHALSSLLFIQQGRTAATRGLLHDFSNVMVGLCSLSENAVEETEKGTALHDDMEIIRDSAVRAHLLICRISALNNNEPDDPTLMDLPTWLSNEAETIRATMPKGSEVTIAPTADGRPVFVTIREYLLRDFLLMVTTNISRRRPNSRLSLSIHIGQDVRKRTLQILLKDTQTPLDAAYMSGENELFNAILSETAANLNATCQTGRNDDGSLFVTLTLNGK
jgi:hypothetical protein